jgi:UDP-glucose 4-epimerase
MVHNEEPEHVLVTGGAGFIGSQLCERLLGLGHRVTAIDDLSNGRREHLAQALEHPAFRFVQADLRAPGALGDSLGRPRVAFHLAANSDIRTSAADPGADLERTLGTTLALLQAAPALGLEQLVFASSSAVFGPLPPGAEPDEGYGPCAPISFYGAAKLASEGFLSATAHQRGLRCWVARFPNVVGGRATHGILHDLMAKLAAGPQALEVLGDGSQTKPYILVDDLIDALLLGWRSLPGPVELFHISGQGSASVAWIAQALIEACAPGTPIRYTGGAAGWPGDVPRYAYAPGRLDALGWRARLDSKQAVREAIRRLRDERPIPRHAG